MRRTALSSLVAALALALMGSASSAGALPSVDRSYTPVVDEACDLVADAATPTVRCTWTGPGEHAVVVPRSTGAVDVVVRGGRGGNGRAAGGAAVTLTGRVPVTPGSTIYAVVGGNGVSPDGSAAAGAGGFNGGGSATLTGRTTWAAGGGGASDLRSVAPGTDGSLDSRFVVAGGGGGGTYRPADQYGQSGGHGGYAALDVSASWDGPSSTGGGGGTASAGGAAGRPRGEVAGYQAGTPGSFGAGGAGAWLAEGDERSAVVRAVGGGGGGGWYGGGGGGHGTGGGGGSSLAPAGLSTTYPRAEPLIEITYTLDPADVVLGVRVGVPSVLPGDAVALSAFVRVGTWERPVVGVDYRPDRSGWCRPSVRGPYVECIGSRGGETVTVRGTWSGLTGATTFRVRPHPVRALAWAGDLPVTVVSGRTVRLDTIGRSVGDGATVSGEAAGVVYRIDGEPCLGRSCIVIGTGPHKVTAKASGITISRTVRATAAGQR